MRPSIVAIALVLFGPHAAMAEADADSPAALFGARAEVRVVNVETFVTRDGEPVSGLKREDFRILVDGEPVELLYFSEVGSSPEPPESGVSSGGEQAALEFDREPGRLVVYVDSLFLGASRRDRLFSQMIDTLEGTLAPRDEVMVVSFDGSIKIRSPFTTDRKETYRALAEAAELNGIQVAASLEELRDFQTIHQYQSLSEHSACLYVGAVAQQHAQRMQQRVVASATAMKAFVNSLGGIPGRKAVLHVSDGIPLIAGGSAWRYAIELCDGTGAIKGVPSAMDAPVQDGGGSSGLESDKWNPTHYRNEMFAYDTSEHWRRLTAHANAHNVAIYPVQASGLSNPNLFTGDQVRTSQETARFAHWNRQDSLVLMGEETGGRAILNTNDFRDSITNVVADSRHYYLLGFEPEVSGSDDYHEIRVAVDRPGARVRHRKSYWAKSSDEEVADGVLTSLFHSRGENPLEADLSIEPARRGSGLVEGRVTVRLRVPFEHLTMLPRESNRHGMLTVVFAARSLEGEMAPIRQASLPLRVPSDSREEEFVYEVEMPVDGEGKQIAVAVRDDFGNLTSYLRETVRLASR